MTLNWGTYSWVDGLKIADCKSLRDLARKGGSDLLHVINILLKNDSDEAEDLAEELFELYA